MKRVMFRVSDKDKFTCNIFVVCSGLISLPSYKPLTIFYVIPQPVDACYCLQRLQSKKKVKMFKTKEKVKQKYASLSLIRF